jgi:hypothetical protein
VRVNIHKYPYFEDYYVAITSRLKSSRINNSKEELKEFVYVLYYKDIPDTMAITLIENFYTIYKKYLNA